LRRCRKPHHRSGDEDGRRDLHDAKGQFGAVRVVRQMIRAIAEDDDRRDRVLQLLDKEPTR
jgi:hypothetical protein